MILVFQPPYCPQVNPIEMLISGIFYRYDRIIANKYINLEIAIALHLPQDPIARNPNSNNRAQHQSSSNTSDRANKLHHEYQYQSRKFLLLSLILILVYV